MKPSKQFKFAALAVTVGIALTSCSLLRVKTEVAAQEVKLDLTLGAPPVAAFPTQSQIALPTIPIPSFTPFPPVDEPTETPTPEPTFSCPPQPTAQGARDVADPDVNVSDLDPEQDDTPVEGEYRFRYEYNYEAEPATRTEGHKILELMPDNPTTQQKGRDLDRNELRFSVDDTITNIKMYFHTVGVETLDSTPNANPGLYLTAIEIPRKDRLLENRYFFDPEPDLQLLRFPIEEDMNVVSAASDAGLKNDLPVPGTPGRPSANQMRSEVTVGGREQIEVCVDYAQGWKVNWDLRIEGESPIVMNGLFWLATAYGGWPVREEFVLSVPIAAVNPLISGNFSSNMMMLDPTGYL